MKKINKMLKESVFTKLPTILPDDINLVILKINLFNINYYIFNKI